MNDIKNRILEAATEIFVDKGFSGTSISAIAHRADINQSLIYHHIGCKQELWQEVKKKLIGKGEEEKKLDYQSWEHFIKDVIQQRLTLYEQNPKILRMIQWQTLEDKKELQGKTYISPVNWIDIIKTFQDKKYVRIDYDASSIADYIHSLINGLLYDAFNIFSNNPSSKKSYIMMIENEIIKSFKSMDLNISSH